MPDSKGDAEQDGDVAAQALREERGGGLLVQQRVAARQHQAVDIGLRDEGLQDIDIVESGTEGADRAFRAQLGERGNGTAQRLLQALVDALAVVAPVHVVDQGNVDAVDPETPEARLERAHGPVVAVVELNLEGASTDEKALRDPAVGGRPQQLADLGRQHPLTARASREGTAQPLFLQGLGRTAVRCRSSGAPRSRPRPLPPRPSRWRSPA
jgi:hypothetical protein